MKQEALKFKRFLEENHAFDEYVENINSINTGGAASSIGAFQSLSQFIEKSPAKFWLTSAFFHHKTNNPQKWGRLAVKWEAILTDEHFIAAKFQTEKYLKLKSSAKELGLTPQKFIEIAVDNYIQEIELNIQKAKENGNNNQIR